MTQPRTEQLLIGLGRLHLNLPDAPQIYLEIRTQRLVVRALEDVCDELPVALAGARSGELSPGKRARVLHAQRKQVKTARAVTPVLDSAAAHRSRLNKALRDVQELLGDHHDTVICREWLQHLAVREPEAAELASQLRRSERRTQAAVEEQLPRAVGRLVRRVDQVRRTPAVHLSSP
jgi:CHAD domain-containing protein